MWAVVVPDRTGTRRSDGAALAAAARRKQASFQAAARTGDAAGVSFQAVILDTYGRREQCGAAFLETLVAAYMRHRGVSKMLASTALHRSLSLAVYRSVAAAVLLRHPGPTLPVASQHWLETGRRLFVGECSVVFGGVLSSGVVFCAIIRAHSCSLVLTRAHSCSLMLILTCAQAHPRSSLAQLSRLDLRTLP
ncbi:hypothetical protein FVE85_1196 [Porphyridium purpureum]|uniref:Uncharacterized protein n=1 Tax=Porphyridium purpureum TaxID=35688 RepID=A0A5J4Z4G0_PORPP|nr:hypothetical protein FVE85_1196 [Porphyridium purpureum]|eukprot:POR2291..scf208_2